MKAIIFISVLVFSSVGAYIPTLWGDDNGFGIASILCSGIGGIFGVWAGYKIGSSMEV
jgi:hypothetical protein